MGGGGMGWCVCERARLSEKIYKKEKIHPVIYGKNGVWCVWGEWECLRETPRL